MMNKVIFQNRHLVFLVSLVLLTLPSQPGQAAEEGSKVPPVVMKQVAPDLYFHFDYDSSNSIIWVTDEGVLVIDTRWHPRGAKDLIEKIRKITDKPIRWAVVTQAHGDHYLGNQVFKEQGAMIASQIDAARNIEKYFDKDLARRGASFKRYGFNPAEIKMTLPDVTFETQMNIKLGGKIAQLVYFGPAQDPGASFIYFPHAKALATGGSFARQSWANPMYTPSVDGWIAALHKIMKMDVDVYLPGHGDVGTKKDVQEAIDFLVDLQTAVKDAIAKGMSKEQAAKTLQLPKYKDWRNADRGGDNIAAMHHLLTTGKSAYLDR
ncbi:MAG TPA: MBL fold metallo-hydrolase [Candidatus Binatia bacterium]|jgi:glyoxylase-like metal-dependent hydrolase (beta-lactamase superfamily II)